MANRHEAEMAAQYRLAPVLLINAAPDTPALVLLPMAVRQKGQPWVFYPRGVPVPT
jgi:hypothetical protein